MKYEFLKNRNFFFLIIFFIIFEIFLFFTFIVSLFPLTSFWRYLNLVWCIEEVGLASKRENYLHFRIIYSETAVSAVYLTFHYFIFNKSHHRYFSVLRDLCGPWPWKISSAGKSTMNQYRLHDIKFLCGVELKVYIFNSNLFNNVDREDAKIACNILRFFFIRHLITNRLPVKGYLLEAKKKKKIKKKKFLQSESESEIPLPIFFLVIKTSENYCWVLILL